jgi:hypothetical protein
LLLNNYSPKYVSSKIDKVAKKIPYFPILRPLACGTTRNNIDQFNWLNKQLNRYNPAARLDSFAEEELDKGDCNLSI